MFIILKELVSLVCCIQLSNVHQSSRSFLLGDLSLILSKEITSITCWKNNFFIVKYHQTKKNLDGYYSNHIRRNPIFSKNKLVGLLCIKLRWDDPTGMSDQNATIAECFMNIKSSLAIYQSAMETQQTIGALTKYNHLTVLLGHMGEVVVLFRKFILDKRTTG